MTIAIFNDLRHDTGLGRPGNGESVITAVLDIEGSYRRPSANPKKSCILEHVALLSFLDENGVPKTDLDPAFDETRQMDYRGGESYKFLIRHHSMLSQHCGWFRRIIATAKNMGAERLLVRQHQIMYTQKLRPEYDLEQFDHLGKKRNLIYWNPAAGSYEKSQSD